MKTYHTFTTVPTSTHGNQTLHLFVMGANTLLSPDQFSSLFFYSINTVRLFFWIVSFCCSTVMSEGQNVNQEFCLMLDHGPSKGGTIKSEEVLEEETSVIQIK